MLVVSYCGKQWSLPVRPLNFSNFQCGGVVAQSKPRQSLVVLRPAALCGYSDKDYNNQFGLQSSAMMQLV